jgi:tetratricopeptide (TPR) repeat protein
MDADDRLDEENRAKLRSLFASLPDRNVAYLMKCMIIPAPGDSESVRVVDHTRLFRNDPRIRWHYRVHEQILPAIYGLGGEVRRSDVVIQHIGYQDAVLRPKKLERNLRLLQLDNAERPNDSFTLYNLGRSLERLGRIGEALPYWQRSLQHAPSYETYVPKLYSLIAEGYSQLGRRNEMTAVCLGGLARFPDHPELLFRAGTLLKGMGDIPAAAACFERLLAQSSEMHFLLGDDTGIRYKTQTLLGRIYRDQQRTAEAEAQWIAALKEAPDFAQALLGLGQLLLDQRRWEEFDKVIARLDRLQEGIVEAAVLRGLRHLACSEPESARKLMEDTITRFPNVVEPRVLLSRILMAEGRDMAAVERALRAILAIDPQNAEARRGLAKLLPIHGA